VRQHRGRRADGVRSDDLRPREASDFDVVRVTGSMLRDPLKGTVRLLRALGDVAKRHGKRLEIGPI
jgi:hypothetical protein